MENLTFLVEGETVYQVIGGQYIGSVIPPMDRNNLKTYGNPNLSVVKPVVAAPPGYQIVNVNACAEKYSQNSAQNLLGYTIPSASSNIICGNLGTVLNNNMAPLQVPANVVQNNQTSYNTLWKAGNKDKTHINNSTTYNNCDQNKNLQEKEQVMYYNLKPPDAAQKRIPEPTPVKADIDSRKKIGTLKIHVSESFMPWNMKGGPSLDVNFMRHIFDITTVGIQLIDVFVHEVGVCNAVKSILHSKILSDWLILKCEAKQIPFFKVNDQVEVYSIHNFSSLVSIIVQESCLPLPFVTKDSTNRMKYFFINFPRKTNDKITKLNCPIFYDADNGRKKLPCKFPGIRLDCVFDRAIQRFIIHVHKSAVQFFEANVASIRQVIIYNHIVWGFLQSWTRRIQEHYNGCFKLDDIVRNLSLCRVTSAELSTPNAEERDFWYFVGFTNLYLKFDPVSLKETGSSFTIENFETNFVASVPIVQYYRQFFLVNDLHYSDALQNVVMFFERSIEPKNAQDVMNIGLKPVRIITSLPGKPIEESNQSNQWQTELPKGDNSTKDIKGNTKAECINKTPSALPPDKPPLKPLIKARTVEEINSSVCIQGGEPQRGYSYTSGSVRVESGLIDSDLPSFVREHLFRCYFQNSTDLTSVDETSDPRIMKQRFDEAVEAASVMTSLEAFIETLYRRLQLHFTNATCQNIVNTLIHSEVNKKCLPLTALVGTTAPNPTLVTVPQTTANHKNNSTPPIITIDSDASETQTNVVSETTPRVSFTEKMGLSEGKTEKKKSSIESGETSLNEPNSSAKKQELTKNELATSQNKEKTTLKESEAVHNESETTLKESEAIHNESETPLKESEAIHNESEATLIEPKGSLPKEVATEANEEEQLKLRFGIKPCSVLLNRINVVQRLRPRKRKPMRIYDDSDSEESEMEVPLTRRRSKRISDLEYMEARTRVLQRLRKRPAMFIGNPGHAIYTSEELDAFLVTRNSLRSHSSRRSSNCSTLNDLDLEEEDPRLKCAQRELRVVLQRLEDMPGYECYKVKTEDEPRRLRPRKDSRTSEVIPVDKREYLEMRDGKIYLKEEYCVRDGSIVLKGSDSHRPKRIRPKSEPILVEGETDMLCGFLKLEPFCD